MNGSDDQTPSSSSPSYGTSLSPPIPMPRKIASNSSSRSSAKRVVIGVPNRNRCRARERPTLIRQRLALLAVGCDRIADEPPGSSRSSYTVTLVAECRELAGAARPPGRRRSRRPCRRSGRPARRRMPVERIAPVGRVALEQPDRDRRPVLSEARTRPRRALRRGKRARTCHRGGSRRRSSPRHAAGLPSAIERRNDGCRSRRDTRRARRRACGPPHSRQRSASSSACSSASGGRELLEDATYHVSLDRTFTTPGTRSTKRTSVPAA